MLGIVLVDRGQGLFKRLPQDMAIREQVIGPPVVLLRPDSLFNSLGALPGMIPEVSEARPPFGDDDRA